MKVRRCRHRVSRETKITIAISHLRDEIRNKEHLVLRVADSSCEGRPFLVDACPCIVTPAYAKPRPRIPLPGLRGSSPFASLFSDTFLHVHRRKSCRRHVLRHGLNLSERSTKGNHKSVRARWERGLNVLHVIIYMSRPDCRNWNFCISFTAAHSFTVFLESLLSR